MKTLLVMRHAKSSWAEPGVDDHARLLNSRGERDAPAMGQLVRDERMAPDLVISSDAARARLTAEAMAEAAEFSGTILLEPRLYHASLTEIVAVLQTVTEDVATLMIVGHNPGLEELVARLTAGRADFPTAALAQITLPIDDWADFATTTRGTLVGLWRPKDLL